MLDVWGRWLISLVSQVYKLRKNCAGVAGLKELHSKGSSIPELKLYDKILDFEMML